MSEKHIVAINTEFIKLDSFLKFCGVAETGGHAKEIITLEQVVYVNGELCTQRGKKLYDGDTVKIDDLIFEVRKGEN